MKIQIIHQNFDKNLWNKKAPHPLQSWQWGEARKTMGIEVLRLTDGKDVYQLTLHQLPLFKYKIGYLPRSVFPTNKVLTFLANYATENNIIF
ncbi:MAG: hypothetical protein ACK4FL_02160, partial [Microgenomates group bacterium]